MPFANMKKLFTVAIGLIASVVVLGQSPQITSDFELYGDHIFIKLSIDDSEPLDFILDTGDGLTVIDLDIAEKLKLSVDHKQTTTSAQGSVSGALIKHNKVALEGLVLENNIKVYATDLKHLEISIGRNIDGIIGYDMLHHHVVRLDYDSMKVELYDYATGYPKNGIELPFKMHFAIPVVKGIVTLNNGETIDGTFYMNTGAGTTLDFNAPFADSNQVINKTGEHYSYLVKGLGQEETRHYEGRVRTFRFGSNIFENLPVGISQIKAGIQGDKKVSGIIGNRILSQYNILFDYKAHKLYMEPNGRQDIGFPVNCSGLDVQLSEDMSKVLIHQVLEGTQAEAAGIKVNDVLVSINGTPAKDLTLIEIEDILKKSGTTVQLTIDQDGSSKDVSLDLKSLL